MQPLLSFVLLLILKGYSKLGGEDGVEYFMDHTSIGDCERCLFNPENVYFVPALSIGLETIIPGFCLSNNDLADLTLDSFDGHYVCSKEIEGCRRGFIINKYSAADLECLTGNLFNW